MHLRRNDNQDPVHVIRKEPLLMMAMKDMHGLFCIKVLVGYMTLFVNAFCIV